MAAFLDRGTPLDAGKRATHRKYRLIRAEY
jgi:hypothetical protein